MKRPSTLAEVAQRELDETQSYGFALSEFLDSFYLAARDKRISMLSDEPPLLSDKIKNAFLGAVGEHLSTRWDCPPVPAWTNGPNRFLMVPYYASEAKELHLLLEQESPPAFRRRNIFTEAEPLRRARMPRP